MRHGPFPFALVAIALLAALTLPLGARAQSSGSVLFGPTGSPRVDATGGVFGEHPDTLFMSGGDYLLASTDGGLNWQHRSVPYAQQRSGFVRTSSGWAVRAQTDPNRQESQLFTTDSHFTRWQLSPTLLPDGVRCFAPWRSDSLLYSVQNTLYATPLDGGQRREIRTRLGGSCISDGRRRIAAGVRSDLITLSSDGGATWKTVNAGEGTQRLRDDVTSLRYLGADTLLAAFSGTMWRTTDEGESWARVHSFAPSILSDFHTGMDGLLYFVHDGYWRSEDENDVLHVSRDRGATWEPLETSDIQADPLTNPARGLSVFARSESDIFLQTAAFGLVPLVGAGLLPTAPLDVPLANVFGYLYRGQPGDWQPQTDLPGFRGFTALASSDTLLQVLGIAGGGVRVYEELDNNWSELYDEPGGYTARLVAVSPLGGTAAAAGGTRVVGVFDSTASAPRLRLFEGQQGWRTIDASGLEPDSWRALSYSKQRGNFGVLGGARVLTSADGAQWNELAPLPPSAQDAGGAAFGEASVVVSLPDAVYACEGACEQWSKATGALPDSVGSVAALRSGFAAMGRGGVSLSESGTQWQALGTGLEERRVNVVIEPARGHFVAGTDTGVYELPAGESEWRFTSQTMPEGVRNVIGLAAMRGERLLAVTPRQTYRSGRYGWVVSGDDPLVAEAPVVRVRAHPNPSSGAFEVAVEAPGGGELSLYNALGRLVARATVPAGAVTVASSDLMTRALASGTYFLRLTTPGGAHSSSLIISH